MGSLQEEQVTWIMWGLIEPNGRLFSVYESESIAKAHCINGHIVVKLRCERMKEYEKQED